MDYYDIGYEFGSVLGAIFVFFILFVLISFAVWIFQIVATWQVYKKVGYEGWEAIIPFYSDWILVKAANLNWWWFLFIIVPWVLPFIPVLNFLSFFGSIAMLFGKFNCFYNLSKKFNKSTGFAICLTLFTPICMAILGFSKNNVCNPNVILSNNGVFDASGDNNSNNNQQYNGNKNDNLQKQSFSFCGNCGTKLNNEEKFCPNCGTPKI